MPKDNDNTALLRRAADSCDSYADEFGDEKQRQYHEETAARLRALAEAWPRYEAALRLARAVARIEHVEEWDPALTAYRALGEEA